MITQEFSGIQIERLMGLDYFPSNKAAVKELRLAIEAAGSEAIATRIVTDWLAEHSEAPKPAELRRLVVAAKPGPDLEELRPDPHCARCGGEGFEHIERNGLSAAGPRCSCWARRPAPKIDYLPFEAPGVRQTRNDPLASIRELRRTRILTALDGDSR